MHQKIRVILIVVLLFTFITPAFSYLTVADINRLPRTTADMRFHYGKAPRQIADLRLPKTPGPYPVVIVIHGGCWLAKYANLDNTAPLATALTAAGVATWNIDYRCVDSPGGGWPGTFQDVGNAIDYLQIIAPKSHLDLNRVVIMGHSAGGHLALWAAARHKLPNTSILYAKKPLMIRGVVDLAGPGSLASFIPLQVSVCNQKIITQLMGGNPDQQHQRYQQGSPIELLPLGVKQILLTGEADPYVPPRLAKEYFIAAKTAGDDVHFILIKNAAHIDLISPKNTNTWKYVKQAVFDLLN